ncbi:hypothetical protein O0555_06305 [Brevibacillus laterosporus]|uniref:Uncharacterized protein n=1 Tax=Brevibacillus laterosporus TaxID=1465 RepID=A0AAP8QEC0_BRELA|nr:hypothetical protein [Brevibacillus laterosporus]MCR8936964.1 hypothetical protein [Brevibacillus laterosporus]MCZ0839602.1 hypothetical protein [Brevibacillus laterosporus]MCZ0844709.1 hypothetical protein [Brevibacillus laterosporus]PPB08276.1 hypothetical protein C4A77_08840 [Brevibacillus laterosporus]
MNYEIQASALLSFVSFFYIHVEENIRQMYNPDFIIHKGTHEVSLLFQKEQVVKLTIVGNLISELTVISYDSFIPDRLMECLLEITNLPPRLSRYKRSPNNLINLREEIKNSLIMGKINLRSSGFAEWNEYKIGFKFSEEIILDKIMSLK